MGGEESEKREIGESERGEECRKIDRGDRARGRVKEDR
jgi:hypothetical protein